MKHFENMQRQASRILKAFRRLWAPQEERPSIYEDMEIGAVTGFFACTAMAFYFIPDSLSAALLISISLLGLFVGAVIGAVLWIGSAELPEDKIRAPAPGQGRFVTERRRHPR